MNHQPPAQFSEVQVTLKGVDRDGKKFVHKMTYKPVNMSLHMSATRPVKVKDGKRLRKFIPSEYVFHSIQFVTSSDSK
jgi:hypothetical protein